ncbi:MAG TPA: hypothetical protein VHB20_10205 [Verrucomicrobiae bacterium]|jgi:hypothetical protein|nr:hypothetical protein [Verrucomicrobiae bacterium]
MQKKGYLLVGALIVLSVIYVHYFTDLFAKRQLIVTPSLRPSFGADGAVYSVVFSLNGQYKIKNLKVVPLENGKVSVVAHPLWSLVADSNSAPTQMFVYGRRPHGMKQAPDNAKAERLQPDVPYRLIVSADGLTGMADFKTRATPGN